MRRGEAGFCGASGTCPNGAGQLLFWGLFFISFPFSVALQLTRANLLPERSAWIHISSFNQAGVTCLYKPVSLQKHVKGWESLFLIKRKI